MVLASCTTAPPARSTLPDVDEVLEPPVACAFFVGEPKGVAVSEVLEDTAADGVLEAGDVIVAVNGVGTVDTEQLRIVLEEQAVGDEIQIDLQRDGASESAALTLGANPENPEQVYIGIMIFTEYERLPASEAKQEIVPSETSRALTIGGTLFGGDPVLPSWSNTGVEIESQANWVATSESVYSLSGAGERLLTDVVSDETIDYELTEDWSPARLIGSIDEDLLIAVTAPVPDEPELVSVGIARFDPFDGSTAWVVGIGEGFGIPVSAWGSPDSAMITVAGVEAGSSEVTGVTILEANGNAAGFDDLLALGTPIGWLDAETSVFRTTANSVSCFGLISARRHSWIASCAINSANGVSG